MSEEHLQRVPSAKQLNQPPKRRRTPSQYASQIADFKNNQVLTTKKTKSIKFIEPITLTEEIQKASQPRPLVCQLPSGKRYMINIVIGTNKSIQNQQLEVKRCKRSESATKISFKQEKPDQVSKSLLDKFLVAFAELQKKQEYESKENHEPNKKERKDIRIYHREERVQKENERQQKWNKWSQKSKCLSERLQKLQDVYTYLI